MKMYRILSFLLLLTTVLSSQEVRVTNIDFTLDGQNIEIRYDLAGNPKMKYKVDVILKRRDLPDYSLKPSNIKGDIGKGKFAGTQRKAVWNYVQEFQPGENYADYYFEVRATELKKIPRGYLYAGSSVVVGIVVAVIFSGEPENDPIGMPPGRP